MSSVFKIDYTRLEYMDPENICTMGRDNTINRNSGSKSDNHSKIGENYNIILIENARTISSSSSFVWSKKNWMYLIIFINESVSSFSNKQEFQWAEVPKMFKVPSRFCRAEE